MNGDGFDDVIVSAPHFSHDQSLEGRVYLYLGSPAGLMHSSSWNAESNQEHSHFGIRVASAGDVNGDRFGDVIVGAEWFDSGDEDEGRAFLYCGSDGSVGTTYCLSNANSTGAPADLATAGTASSSAGELSLSAYPVPNEFGMFFHGANQSQITFGCAYLCVTKNVQKGAVVSAAGNVARTTYDNSDAKHSLAGFVGSIRNFQYWYRDPLGSGSCSGETFNTSNAISIAVLP